jgi:hypothetical protein
VNIAVLLLTLGKSSRSASLLPTHGLNCLAAKLERRRVRHRKVVIVSHLGPRFPAPPSRWRRRAPFDYVAHVRACAIEQRYTGEGDRSSGSGGRGWDENEAIGRSVDCRRGNLIKDATIFQRNEEALARRRWTVATRHRWACIRWTAHAGGRNCEQTTNACTADDSCYTGRTRFASRCATGVRVTNLKAASVG